VPIYPVLATRSYVRADADNCIVCPMQRIARQLLRHGVTTYLYNYFGQAHIRFCDWSAVWNPIAPMNLPLNWSSHGTGIPFMFNTTVGADINTEPQTLHCAFAPQEYALVDAFQSYFTSFAKDGRPTGGPAVWPQANASPDLTTLLLGLPTSYVDGHRKSDCEFWSSLQQ